MPNWVYVVIYGLGIVADFIDSRRLGVPVLKATVLAPVWPVLWALQIMIALIRLPRR